MTDQVLGPKPRRKSVAAYLGGRGDRKEYWVVVGGLTLIGVIVSLFGGDIGYATLGPMLFMMVRRLHDFNRSGWWSAAIIMGPPALMIAAAPIAPPETTAPFIILMSLVWTVWLGAVRGDPHENRFGAPSGARNLKDIFS